jgi:adenylate cyclase class 1
MNAAQGNSITIYHANKEFSSIEHGDELYQAVSLSILAQRQDNTAYPVYITDIDMQRSSPGHGRQQTVYFLKLKKQIEQQLNAVLERVAP